MSNTCNPELMEKIEIRKGERDEGFLKMREEYLDDLCEPIELYTELDSSFPNHPPDPQMPETTVSQRTQPSAGGCGSGSSARRTGATPEA